MKGGKSTALSLIDPTALKIFRYQLAEQGEIDVKNAEKSEEIIKRIRSLYAPKTKDQSLVAFKAMRMKGTGPEALGQFAMEFENLMAESKEFVPPEFKLVELFILALQPKRLSELVEAEFPKSVAQTIITAFAMVGNGETATAAAAAPRPPIVCHQCGEPGHIRPDCPKRDSPPAANTRLKAKKTGQMNTVRLVGSQSKGAHVPAEIGDAKVSVLWDTGSTIDAISSKLAESLIRGGVCCEEVNERVGTLFGDMPVTKVVHLDVVFRPKPGLPRVARLKCKVLDMDEDLILGHPSTTEHGLTSIMIKMLEG